MPKQMTREIWRGISPRLSETSQSAQVKCGQSIAGLGSDYSGRQPNVLDNGTDRNTRAVRKRVHCLHNRW
ncbi:hypothetical protein Mapa_017662 [Marchantia paleacea]|nr:hypothetical protein Mapa_017662 [Marchantia paleacea]